VRGDADHLRPFERIFDQVSIDGRRRLANKVVQLRRVAGGCGPAEGRTRSAAANSRRIARGDIYVDRILNGLLKVSRGIDAINLRIGKWLCWLVLVAVLVSAVNATVRKLFDSSSNAWLELQWVLFSAVFLLCSPWTLLSNEHIRIDILNNAFPKTLRNIIDVVGHAFFLLPLTIILIITSYPVFLDSFRINEQSFSAGGLPQWPAKSLMVIGFVLLFAQGVSELIKRIAVMRGLIPDSHERNLHPVESEVENLIKVMEKR
jgi:TRAP-type mannitol/chloroaromatic compound transport system permease small subunit